MKFAMIWFCLFVTITNAAEIIEITSEVEFDKQLRKANDKLAVV